MRACWPRLHPEITLEHPDITTLLRPVFPGATVVASERVIGGLANTNLKVWISGHAAPLLLRLYQRGHREAMKEAALLRRLSGQVPVAGLRFFSINNPLAEYPYAVIDWVAGERLDVLAATGEDVLALGRAVGQTLAAQELCSGLQPYMKRHHVQTGVGHYGVFNGQLWKNYIYPILTNIIYASD